MTDPIKTLVIEITIARSLGTFALTSPEQLGDPLSPGKDGVQNRNS